MRLHNLSRPSASPIQFNVKAPGILYEDNEAAIYLSKNEHVSARTKHIDVRQHYIREHINNGHGTIVKVKSEKNFADVLTKNVSVGVFKELGSAIINGFEGHDDVFKISEIQREND